MTNASIRRSWRSGIRTVGRSLVTGLADDRLSLTDVQTLMRHRSLTTLTDYSAARLDELVTRLHEHLARPAPPSTVAVGYDQDDMQVL